MNQNKEVKIDFDGFEQRVEILPPVPVIRKHCRNYRQGDFHRTQTAVQ
jgi:hypothetical protein